MLIELHAIQNFAPSNLNRDDTGAPKDCIFGGYRRARVSSQAFKRAMRMKFRDGGLLPDKADIGTRTKRIVQELTERLGDAGIAEEEAKPLIERALGGLGLKLEEGNKTQYLLFVGPRELDALAAACVQLRDAGESGAAGDGAAKSGRNAKKDAKSAITGEMQKTLKAAMDGGKAADIALFGRMIADNADINTDAACQVAHAISTHKTDIEFDYYTAVDDLNPKEETGAGMIGTVEFNSACFYRYANVDVEQLQHNLGGDVELAMRTLEAFIRASISAVPTGKQNSMAAQNPPSLVLAVVRQSGLWSLANAFVQPVRADRDGDLVDKSIGRLDEYWGKLTRMYGAGPIEGAWVCSLDGGLEQLADAQVESVDDVVRSTLDAVSAVGSAA